MAAVGWARWHPSPEPTGQGHPFGRAPVWRGLLLSASSGRMFTLGRSRCLRPLELVPLCPWGFCLGAGLSPGTGGLGPLGSVFPRKQQDPGMVVIRTTPRRAISPSPSLRQVRGVCDHLSRGLVWLAPLLHLPPSPERPPPPPQLPFSSMYQNHPCHVTNHCIWANTGANSQLTFPPALDVRIIPSGNI